MATTDKYLPDGSLNPNYVPSNPSTESIPGQSGQYGGINPGGTMYTSSATQPVPQSPTPTLTSPVVADPSGVLGSSTVNAAVPTYNVGEQATQFMQSQPTSQSTNQQYISPQATIAGQMTSLLNSSSPWMKAAETRAEERANKAGLLSSSMAVGAAHRAAIEQALPVAQGDAATYAQSNLANQNLMNQGVLAGQQSNLAMQQNQQNFQNQSALQRQGANEALTASAVDANNKMAMEQYSQDATTARMQLEYQAKADIQKNTDNVALAQQQMQAIQETTKQYEASYVNILTNPDFADEVSRNAALEKLRIQHQAAVDWITSSYSTISFNGDAAPVPGTTSPSVNTGTATTTPTNTVDYGNTGGGVLQTPGTNSGVSSDSYYAPIAQNMPADYASFNQALVNSNGQTSDDFFKASQSFTPVTTPPSGEPGLYGYKPESTTSLTKDQQWDVYSKVMYAALNPSDTAADTAAKDAILSSGIPVSKFDTSTVAPSQQGSIPLFNQWVNANIYAPAERNMGSLQTQASAPRMPGSGFPDQGLYWVNEGGKWTIQQISNTAKPAGAILIGTPYGYSPAYGGTVNA